MNANHSLQMTYMKMNVNKLSAEGLPERSHNEHYRLEGHCKCSRFDVRCESVNARKPFPVSWRLLYDVLFCEIRHRFHPEQFS